MSARQEVLLSLRCTALFMVLSAFVLTTPAAAQTTFVFDDVSPNNSDTDAQDPDGATGGRVNGLAIQADDNEVQFAATEWGGVYKSTDAGLTWAPLVGHLPKATWDVEIDPGTPQRVIATSFFDGRATSRAGINLSLDGGVTWTHPPTSVPPAGFCNVAADQSELSAFGIAFDPGDPAKVYAGTNCGLAISADSGLTWSFVDPTPAPGTARRVWDVLALGGGVLHICGDDGHLRSGDGGTSWVAGSGLASGRCSLAVSPDEPYVLLAVVGTSIYETDNADALGGASWTQTRSNPSPQGRIPFVETNQRSDVGASNVFDLWFGDVSLYRVSCTTPDPPAPGGSARCGTGSSPAWVGGFTRNAGGHDDMGGLLFDSEAVADACPVLMASDGGVYYNTDTSADCHNPNWEQPDVTPHALWPFSMSGSDRSGKSDEDLYFGNQDNGLFGTTLAGDASVPWHNEVCCDGFDTAGDLLGSVYTVCCFGGGGRSTRTFRAGPGMVGSVELNTYPPGGLSPSFDFPDSIVRYGDSSYVMVSRDCTPGAGGCVGADGGVFITDDIDANPVAWTELGALSEPPTSNICAVEVSIATGDPTFFVQSGSCNSAATSDRLFKFTPGVGASWQELFLPSGGFGVFAVHPKDASRLLASGLTAGGGAMFSSSDGGSSWKALPALDSLMIGGGDFAFKNQRGPTQFTGFSGYWQPTLVAFDGETPLVVAGGQDSGVFLSQDGGDSWSLLTDPSTPEISGVPHLPRPRYAYFDSEPGEDTRLYIGSQGAGIWRVTVVLDRIFGDGFEIGDTSLWTTTVIEP